MDKYNTIGPTIFFFSIYPSVSEYVQPILCSSHLLWWFLQGPVTHMSDF